MHVKSNVMYVRKVLLNVRGEIFSLLLAPILMGYNSKKIAKMVLRRHILHMLRVKDMSAMEVIESVKYTSTTISLGSVPVMLVKLQQEGLIQRQGNNRYVITGKGLESLKNLDAISKEFQGAARLMRETFVPSNFVVRKAIDTLAAIRNVDKSNVQGRFALAVNEGSGCSNYRMNSEHENGDGSGFNEIYT